MHTYRIYTVLLPYGKCTNKKYLRTEMSDRGKGQLAEKELEEEEEIKRLFLEIMEGYNDSAIPPLSYFSPFQANPITENGSISKKRAKNEAAWAESLDRERKRREQMNEKFSVLQSMVPSLSETFKLPREKIVEDTVNYINYLEEEIKRLEGLKKFTCLKPNPVLSKCTNPNSSVKVAVSNGATFLAIQIPSRHGLVLEIAKILEKHQINVIEARVHVDDDCRVLTFTATIMAGIDGDGIIEKIKEEILAL